MCIPITHNVDFGNSFFIFYFLKFKVIEEEKGNPIDDEVMMAASSVFIKAGDQAAKFILFRPIVEYEPQMLAAFVWGKKEREKWI